jgi:hypothetical protein
MRSLSRFCSASSAFFNASASRFTAAAVNLTGASILSKLGIYLGFVPENCRPDWKSSSSLALLCSNLLTVGRASVASSNLYLVLSSYSLRIASVLAFRRSSFSFSISTTVFLKRPLGTGLALTSLSKPSGSGITFGLGLVKLNGTYSVAFLTPSSINVPLCIDCLPPLEPVKLL